MCLNTFPLPCFSISGIYLKNMHTGHLLLTLLLFLQSNSHPALAILLCVKFWTISISIFLLPSNFTANFVCLSFAFVHILIFHSWFSILFYVLLLPSFLLVILTIVLLIMVKTLAYTSFQQLLILTGRFDCFRQFFSLECWLLLIRSYLVSNM